MNIDIIAIGNIKEKFLKEGINEYIKRITKYSNINIIELPEISPKDNSNKSIQYALDKEAKNILGKLTSKDFIITLDIKGKQLDNIQLSKVFEEEKLSGTNDFSFIIGSSHGLSDNIKEKSNLKLSFSKLTFPHQLMRLILLEQIYRTFKIINNEPYHK
ncbi:23S rRNA (pseudouridine(1915)-N(3))-methyltransferase RlmH [Miniphocaeibacter massiliensis]|uniref:23S rRNA (pseudouridine(1915)-N(3))-methyltransferase RlmH n=1 Tax=Miniphocaeibacter massiliensis TaxID=2041841 RepID=UPI000C1C13F5|nr:23S rRNA (pseudouridine(1915)-N(3))-methyltransferase RlmH [Miniphocaeibacter massiliensis]